jgi:hypothetical protein
VNPPVPALSPLALVALAAILGTIGFVMWRSQGDRRDGI